MIPRFARDKRSDLQGDRRLLIMKMWSKVNKSITCETFTSDGDHENRVPAQLFGLHTEEGDAVPDPFYSLVKLDEWSDTEPVVWDGPPTGFLVIFDKGFPRYAPTVDAAQDMLDNNDAASGYVPVTVSNLQMVSRED